MERWRIQSESCGAAADGRRVAHGEGVTVGRIAHPTGMHADGAYGAALPRHPDFTRLDQHAKGSARPGGVEAKRPPRGGRDGRCPVWRPGYFIVL